MSWGVSPWLYPVWDSLGFLDLSEYFLPHFREVFNYYLPKYFVMVFLFVFFFWDSYDSNVGVFNIVPEVPEVVLISFNFFSFSSLLHLFLPFYLLSHLSSIFYLTYHSIFYLSIFCLRYSLLVPSRVFLISFIALFIIN